MNVAEIIFVLNDAQTTAIEFVTMLCAGYDKHVGVITQEFGRMRIQRWGLGYLRESKICLSELRLFLKLCDEISPDSETMAKYSGEIAELRETYEHYRNIGGEL